MRYRNSSNQDLDDRNDATESESQSLILEMKKYKKGFYSNNLSCIELHESNPSQVGYLHKYSPNIWTYLFPCFFQPWKRRYFVVIGNYIYRYVSDHEDVMKGIPIPIDSINVKLIQDNDHSIYIEISTIRKVYKLRATNIEEGNLFTIIMNLYDTYMYYIQTYNT